MPLEAKQFDNTKKIDEKIISKRSMDIHRDKLYMGYVNKTNEIRDKLKTADRSKAAATYSEYGELKRRETFNINGVVLHENYFSLLGGDGTPKGKVKQLIERDFGSVDKLKEDLLACSLAGLGWAVLCYDYRDEQLHIYLVDFHHHGAVWGCIPLVAMDVFEHAYFIDYGSDRKTYLEAIWKILNWDAVNDILKKHGIK
jgi:Fe-Mn family superoxide dismutase